MVKKISLPILVVKDLRKVIQYLYDDHSVCRLENFLNKN